MKKLVGLFLGVILLVGLFTVSAQAGGDPTNWAYGFTAYTNGAAFTNAGQFHTKTGTENFIEVRHSVLNSNAGYTNRMCAFKGGTYYGGKWHAPNMIYYTCTSDSLTQWSSITPGGRGNTDYATYQGLATVRLEGQFRTH